MSVVEVLDSNVIGAGTMATRTKKARSLSLLDLLSRLSHATACRLLGSEGASLLQEGGKVDLDPGNDATLSGEALVVRTPDATVTITRSTAAVSRLAIRCSAGCAGPCAHGGAALSLVLEEKMALGLSAPPFERIPIESLTEAELVERALADRAERARTERMRMRAADAETPWTDYTLTSAASGKTYRVALRGTERGVSYCSCPDFRKNTLGTCKHILYALGRVKRRFPASALSEPYRRADFSVYLRYGEVLELRLGVPETMDRATATVVRPLLDVAISDLHDLVRRMKRLAALGHDVRVYPDAEAYLDEKLLAERLEARAAELRADPAGHPLRRSLLKTELLPYQVDGIAFAVGAGRAILADDMGLGKTIQGIGVAELLAREAGIRRVLVICPTSLKSQWHREIARFSDRDAQLVTGGAASRATQYAGAPFFTICNYEQVLRDYLAIERVEWDLLILDEGQRVKNWEAKTSRVVKSLRSRFALVLTGTPLENRLDDLYSVIEVVDDRRLGPAFRFLNRHRMTDERGKVLGYKNLGELRERLAGVLLRRTRADVLKELPPRTTKMVRVPPTEEQRDLHDAYMRVVSTIVRKSYITEMDLLRLQKALLMCRMVANSTFLVEKCAPGYSTKLEELARIVDRLAAEDGRKVVLFSEWTTMLGLIEPLLEARGIGFVRLDGSVPQKKRADIVRAFERDPKCMFFLTTNAGSTGLNLQVADTIINVDLPWNPAVLEQRIARAHRMGQTRPVQVLVLITEGTIEERLLATLSGKHELALAALDPESEVDVVELSSGMEELRSRLEILLGAQPEAPLDVSEAQRVDDEARALARKDRVAAAAGDLLAGALALLGELVPDAPRTEATTRLEREIGASLAECVEVDERGDARLTIRLPRGASAGDAAGAHLATIASLAKTLARLAAAETETST
ncbi:MAG: DEAD/DEAH box helicase [Myxococcales bacterium]|nr:DEAD/DEAH box helicase [Myxococcales bacterium]